MAVKETVELKVIVTPELSRLTSLEQKISQPHNINVGLNIAEAEKGWSKLQGRLNTAITPKINETQLYSLNQHINLKLRHWGELKRELEGGITPTINTSKLHIAPVTIPIKINKAQLQNELKGAKAAIRTQIEVKQAVNVNIEKQTSDALYRAVNRAMNNQKANPLEKLLGVITSPLRVAADEFTRSSARAFHSGTGFGQVSRTAGQEFGQITGAVVKSYADAAAKELFDLQGYEDLVKKFNMASRALGEAAQYENVAAAVGNAQEASSKYFKILLRGDGVMAAASQAAEDFSSKIKNLKDQLALASDTKGIAENVQVSWQRNPTAIPDFALDKLNEILIKNQEDSISRSQDDFKAKTKAAVKKYQKELADSIVAPITNVLQNSLVIAAARMGQVALKPIRLAGMQLAYEDALKYIEELTEFMNSAEEALSGEGLKTIFASGFSEAEAEWTKFISTIIPESSIVTPKVNSFYETNAVQENRPVQQILELLKKAGFNAGGSFSTEGVLSERLSYALTGYSTNVVLYLAVLTRLIQMQGGESDNIQAVGYSIGSENLRMLSETIKTLGMKDIPMAGLGYSSLGTSLTRPDQLGDVTTIVQAGDAFGENIYRLGQIVSGVIRYISKEKLVEGREGTGYSAANHEIDRYITNPAVLSALGEVVRGVIASEVMEAGKKKELNKLTGAMFGGDVSPEQAVLSAMISSVESMPLPITTDESRQAMTEIGAADLRNLADVIVSLSENLDENSRQLAKCTISREAGVLKPYVEATNARELETLLATLSPMLSEAGFNPEDSSNEGIINAAEALTEFYNIVDDAFDELEQSGELGEEALAGVVTALAELDDITEGLYPTLGKVVKAFDDFELGWLNVDQLLEQIPSVPEVAFNSQPIRGEGIVRQPALPNALDFINQLRYGFDEAGQGFLSSVQAASSEIGQAITQTTSAQPSTEVMGEQLELNLLTPRQSRIQELRENIASRIKAKSEGLASLSVQELGDVITEAGNSVINSVEDTMTVVDTVASRALSTLQAIENLVVPRSQALTEIKQKGVGARKAATESIVDGGNVRARRALAEEMIGSMRTSLSPEAFGELLEKAGGLPNLQKLLEDYIVKYAQESGTTPREMYRNRSAQGGTSVEGLVKSSNQLTSFAAALTKGESAITSFVDALNSSRQNTLTASLGDKYTKIFETASDIVDTPLGRQEKTRVTMEQVITAEQLNELIKTKGGVLSAKELKKVGQRFIGSERELRNQGLGSKEALANELTRRVESNEISLDAIKSAIEDVVRQAEEAKQERPERLKRDLKKETNQIVKQVKDLTKQFDSLIQESVAEGGMKTTDKSFDNLLGSLELVYRKLQALIQTAPLDAKDKSRLSGYAGLVQSKIKSLPQGKERAAEALSPIPLDLGQSTAKGATEGLIQGTENYTQANKQLAEEGQQAFRKSNEMHSPSRVYARYGNMLGEGAAKGVMESIPSVTSAIDKLNDAAQDNLDLQGGKGGIHLELSQALEEDSIAPAIDRIKELVGKISGIGDALKDIPFHSTPMNNLNHKGMFRRDTAEVHLNAARHVGSKYGIETEALLGTIAHELRHAAQLYAESNKIAMRYLTPQRGDEKHVEAGIAASTASKQHLPPAILNAARKREEDAYTFELQFNRMFSNLVDSVAVRKDNPEEAALILKTLKVIAHTDRKGLKEEQFPIANINLIKEFKAVGSASREFAKDFQHLLSVLNSYHPNKTQGKALSDSGALQTTPSIAEDVMAGFSDASYDPSWVTPYTMFVDKVKDVFGIASPSKVFAGIRKDINDGFASGSLELGNEEILQLSGLLTELESKAKNVNMDSSELEDYIAKSRELASILKNVGLSSSAKTLEEYNPQAEIERKNTAQLTPSINGFLSASGKTTEDILNASAELFKAAKLLKDAGELEPTRQRGLEELFAALTKGSTAKQFSSTIAPYTQDFGVPLVKGRTTPQDVGLSFEAVVSGDKDKLSKALEELFKTILADLSSTKTAKASRSEIQVLIDSLNSIKLGWKDAHSILNDYIAAFTHLQTLVGGQVSIDEAYGEVNAGVLAPSERVAKAAPLQEKLSVRNNLLSSSKEMGETNLHIAGAANSLRLLGASIAEFEPVVKGLPLALREAGGALVEIIHAVNSSVMGGGVETTSTASAMAARTIDVEAVIIREAEGRDFNALTASPPPPSYTYNTVPDPWESVPEARSVNSPTPTATINSAVDSKEATKRGMDYSHFFARGVILGANRSSSGVYDAIANMLDVDIDAEIADLNTRMTNMFDSTTFEGGDLLLKDVMDANIEAIRETAEVLAEMGDTQSLEKLTKGLRDTARIYGELETRVRRSGGVFEDNLTPLRADIVGTTANIRGQRFADSAIPSPEGAAALGESVADKMKKASDETTILLENFQSFGPIFNKIGDVVTAFGGPVLSQLFGSLGNIVERFGVLKMGGTTAFLAIALGVGAYTTAQAGLAQELKSLSLQFRALGYDGEQSIERMFRLSQKTGTSFRQTAKLGAGIAGSLQFTGIENQTVKLTEQIVKVNTALQLGADESQRFETALVQMLSKGVVSMEEVRQQAAEAVPSFFPALARGLDMTPAEAMKAISAGEVSSAEAVPAALEELTKMSESSYEEGLRSLPASLNRISNSMLEINATFGAAPLGAMSTVSRIFANILEAATPLIKFLAPLASAFVLLGTGVAMKLVLGMTAVSGTMALVGKGVKLWAATTMTAANSVLASMTAMVTKITGLQGVAAGLATGGLIVGVTAAVVAIGGLIHHLRNYHKEYDTLIDIMNNTEVNPHLDTALGEDITGGLSQGVNKGASDYIESIRRTAREGDRAFREENEIQSPSKKMARHGTDLTKGLVQGIRTGQPEVDKTLRELTQESLAMPIFEPKSSNPVTEGTDLIPQAINKAYVGTLEKQIKSLTSLIDGDAFLSELRIKVAYGDVDTAKLSLIEMNKELRKLKGEGGPLSTFGKNESIDKQFGDKAQFAKKRAGDIVSQTLSLTPAQIDDYAKGRRDIEAELNNIEAAIALESSKATPNDSIIDRLNSQANLAKEALAAFDAGLTESGGLATLEAIEAQLESMIKTAEGRGDVELAVSLSNDLAPVKKAINRIKRFTEQNPILIQLTVAEGKFKDAEDALLVNYNETRAKLLKQRASFAITEEQLGLKEAQVDKINADEKIKNLNNYIQERSDILKNAPGADTLAATLGISAEDFDASGFETASMEKLYGLIQDIEKGAPGAEKYANTLDAIKELRQGIVDLSGARLDAAEATRREVQANVTYLASLRDVLGVVLRVNAAREGMNFALEANQTQARIDLARRRVGGEIGGSEYDLENARLSMEQLAQKIDVNSAHMANLSDAIGRLTEEEKAQAAELIGNDIEGASYDELKDFLARKEQASALGQPLGNANIDEAVRARITQFEVGNENLQLEEQQIEAARAQLVEVTASQLRQYRQSIRNFNQSVEDYIQQMNDQLEDTIAEIASLQSQTNLLSQRNALREHLLGATQSIDKEFFELIINAVSGISDILNTQEIRQNARAIRDLTKQNTRTIQSTMDELASIQEQRYEMAGARQPGTVSLGNRLENTGEERLELLDEALQNTGTNLTSGLQGSTQKILNASNNFGGALESGATVLQRSQALAYEKLKQMGAQDYDGWQSAPGVYNASASKLAQQQGMADLRAEYGAISNSPQKSGLDVLRAASIYSSFGGRTKEEQDRALNDFKAQVGDFFDQEFSGEGFNKIGDTINTETSQLTGDMNAAFEKTMAALNDKSVALANLNREKIAEILLGAKEGFDALTRRLPETILQLKQNLRQLDNSIADFALSNAVVLTPQQRQAQQERQRVDTFEGLKLTLEQTKNSLIDAGALLGQDANAETIDRLYSTVDSIASQGSTPQEQAIAKDSAARLRELVDAFAQNGDRLELQASLQEWLASLTAKQNDLLAANNQALMNNTEANRQQRNTQRANIAQSLGGALTDTANTLNISQIDKDYLGAQATYNIALASQAREMDELRNQLMEAGMYSDELFGSMKKLSDLKLERLKDDVRVIESTIRDTLKSGLEGGLNTALDDLLNEGKLDFGKLALDFGKSIIKGIAQPGIDVLSTGLSNVLTTGKWKGNSGVDDALKGGLGSLKDFSSGLSPQIMTVKAGVVNIEGGNALDALGGIINKGEATGSIGEAIDKGISIKDAFKSSSLGSSSLIPNIGGVEDSPLEATAVGLGGLSTTLIDAASELDGNLTDFSEKTGNALGESAGAIGGAVASIPGIIKSFQSGDVGGGILGIVSAALPLIGAFADGGSVGLGAMMTAERAMSGKNPLLAVVHEGEEILTTKNDDAATFRGLKQSGAWDLIKDRTKNYAGGTSGKMGAAAAAVWNGHSRVSSTTNTSNTSIVVQGVSNTQEFARSQTQLANRQELRQRQASRRMTNK